MTRAAATRVSTDEARRRARFQLNDAMTDRVAERAAEWGVSFSEATKRLAVLGEYNIGFHLWNLVMELAIHLEGSSRYPFTEACEAASRVLDEHSRLQPLTIGQQRLVVGNLLGSYRTNAAKGRIKKKVNA